MKVYGPVREQLPLTPPQRHIQNQIFTGIVWESFTLDEARTMSDALAAVDKIKSKDES